MNDSDNGKLVYVTARDSQFHGQAGKITYVYSDRQNINVEFAKNAPRYMKSADVVLVPQLGDRVQLRDRPEIHGTVEVVDTTGTNLKIRWDRFQDYAYAGQSCWGHSPDFVEPAQEPTFAAGDRVRLTYGSGPTKFNGATGAVVGEERGRVLGERKIEVLWDHAEHVEGVLRGMHTWELPTSLTKIEAEAAVEKAGDVVPPVAPEAVTQTLAPAIGEVPTPLPSLEENPFWRAAARALQAVALKRTYFTTDDVWAKLKGVPEGFKIDPRAIGALMVQAEKMGIVQPTKRTKPSKRKECHRRPVRIWKVTEQGKNGAQALAQIES